MSLVCRVKGSIWKSFFSCALLLAICVITTAPIYAKFNCAGRDSRIRLVNSTSSLYINTAISGFNGTFEVSDNAASRVQGQSITFNQGMLESGTECALLSGVYDPTGVDVIKLQGSHRLRCAPGTLLPSISVSGGNNSIEGAPIFSDALTLTDSSALLIFAMQSKLTQSVVLNQGTVMLANDLLLGDNAILGALGVIDCNGRLLSLPSKDSSWTSTLYFSNAQIQLNAPVKHSGMWIFNTPNGRSFINGNGNVFDMSVQSTLWVGANHTLVLTDMVLKGLGGNSAGWLHLEDANSTVSLVNCTLELQQNYNFTQGVLYCYGADSVIITGQSIFSAVNNGVVKIDGIRLSYDSLGVLLQSFLPASPDGINLISINNGLLSAVSSAGAQSTLNMYIDNPLTLLAGNDVISASHQLVFRGNNASSMVFDGGAYALDFARENAATLVVAAGKSATLTNIVLRNFSSAYMSLGTGSSLVFGDKVVVELGRAEDLTLTWSFAGGESTIRGLGCQLKADYRHAIVVYPNTTLNLENVRVTDLSGTAQKDALGNYGTVASHIKSTNEIRCMNSSSKIVLKDADLMLSGDFTFTVGQVEVVGDVNIKGNGKTFVYSSPGTLTIDTDATLYFDRNLTFSYESTASTYATSRNRIIMNSPTSRLYLNGCTLHTTWTGLKLQTGMLVIDDRVLLESEARNEAEAIMFDSGLKVEVLAGAILDLNGLLSYQ